VLASLSTARSKGKDAVIMVNLSVIRAAAEQIPTPYKPTNSCSDPASVFSMQEIVSSLASAKKVSGVDATCISSTNAWAVAMPLVGSSGEKRGLACPAPDLSSATHWCVDSTNASYPILGPLTSDVCPAQYTPPRSSINDANKVDCVSQEVHDLMLRDGVVRGAPKVCPN
jgi:hypothetical protein